MLMVEKNLSERENLDEEVSELSWGGVSLNT